MKLYALCDIENGEMFIRKSGRNYTPAVYETYATAMRVATLMRAHHVIEIDLEKCKIITKQPIDKEQHWWYNKEN